jgi:small subunit ribosomal protein S19
MAKKDYTYRGKTLEELQELSMNELAELLPSKQRRTIKRGFSESQKIMLKKLRAGKNIKTHKRDMMVLPEMVGKLIKIYNGKSFIPISIEPEMIGHLFGEFVLTRKRVAHNSPGVGATRSSSNISVK